MAVIANKWANSIRMLYVAKCIVNFRATAASLLCSFSTYDRLPHNN